jgi:hypothetical protein
MFDYNYTRELVDCCYDINNQYDLDGESNVIPLCCAIKDSALAKDCNIKCAGTVVTISFVDELSGGEETTLDATVAAYKAITA